LVSIFLFQNLNYNRITTKIDMNTMNVKTICLLFVLMAFFSCKETQNSEIRKKNTVDNQLSNNNEIKTSEGYLLIKKYCFTCHSETMMGGMGGSHAAPPMDKVQKQYKKATPDKQHFVNAIKKWVQHPQDDRILLPRSVFIFGRMPALPMPKEDLQKIAETLYQLEYPIHHSSMQVRMPLNKGKAWEIDAVQMGKFNNIAKMFQNFKADTPEAYQQLGWKVVKNANSLILDKGETAKVRTKFYLFFYEINNDISALMSSKSVDEGKKNIQILLPKLLRYKHYFKQKES